MVFLVTAGHVVEDINQRVRQGRQFRYAKIIDRWSEANVDENAVPFPDLVDQSRAPQGHAHDAATGIDYAWFYLRDYYRDLLRRNGITPLDEGAWGNVPEQLDAYNAFGFPDDCVVEQFDGGGRYRGLRIRPRLIPYQPEPNPPPDFRLPYPRLFFWPDRQPDGTVAPV